MLFKVVGRERSNRNDFTLRQHAPQSVQYELHYSSTSQVSSWGTNLELPMFPTIVGHAHSSGQNDEGNVGRDEGC